MIFSIFTQTTNFMKDYERIFTSSFPVANLKTSSPTGNFHEFDNLNKGKKKKSKINQDKQKTGKP